MKYLISAIIVLGLFISQTADAQIRDFINNRVEDMRPSVFSEDRNEERLEKREKIHNKLEEKREKIEERIENKKEEIKEKRSDRAKNIVEKIINRFSAAIERLEKLSLRIQERINILNERDINTEESQNLLDEANNLIEESKKTLEEAREEVDELLNGEFSKEGFREIINGAKNSIKNAHAALIKSISALKVSSTDDNNEENQ